MSGFSLSDIDTEVIDRLRMVLTKANRRLRLAHNDDDLTPNQREVFATIVRCGSIRLGDLASKEGINPTMLSRIVAKLEVRGLVVRRIDDHDGRVIHISATERGQSLHQTMRQERTLALSEAVAHLRPVEQRAIVEALPALEELVDILRSELQ